MPQMANITVKKADGTTDVVYEQVTPSAGDKSPSMWTVPSASTYRNLRPIVQLTTQFNGPRTARRAHIVGSYPIVRTDSGGNSYAAGNIPVDFTITLPQIVSDNEAKEVVYQMGNLIVSALMRDCLTTARSAT
jgi:hypothetical protein